MKIIIDSREKKFDHIKKYFDKNNIPYEIKKLDIGDYQEISNQNISIDRKQNLQELSRNLMNKRDHARFWKEIRRSYKNGVKLIILVEHGNGIKKIEDILKWEDKYSGVSGRKLIDEIFKVNISYNIEFIFCEKDDTPKIIIELLEKS